MKVLVTGAAGFLGRHIVTKLLAEGCQVVAIVRPSSDFAPLRRSGVHLVFGDLRDEATLAAAFPGVDAVVHAAATMAGTWDEYYAINVKSTADLLAHAGGRSGRSGARVQRFVFISSIIVYDHTHTPAGTTFSEDMPLETARLTYYSRSKIEAEELVERARQESGLPTVILRPAALYGPGGAGEVGRSLFPARLGLAAGDNRYLVIGSGKLKLPLSHVESVASAVWAALRSPAAAGQTYNVVEDSGSQAVTQKAWLDRVRAIANPALRVVRLPVFLGELIALLVRLLFGLIGKTPPGRLTYLKPYYTPFDYSNARLRQELGWRPQADLLASIDGMLAEGARRRVSKRPLPADLEAPVAEGCAQGAALGGAKVKVAVAGCGMFAETHFRILRRIEDVEVVALCDLDADVRQEMADRFRVPRTYPDLETLLDNERVDAVHILTPAQTHAELAILAMRRGCHVLVEKPMAANTAEACEMLRVAEEMGVKLTVDHNYLFDAVMVQARELLAKGAIGRVAAVESWFATSYSSNSSSRYLSYAARDQWYYRLPGSLYQNMISHPISLLADVMGEVKNLKVAAGYARVVPHMPTDELRVLADNIGPDGAGVVGVLSLSFAASPRYHFVNIYGTRGSLKIDLLNKYLFVDRPAAMLPKVLTRSLATLQHGLLLLGATLRNTANTLLRRYSLFEGNERLIRLFYRSILLDEPLPVSPQEGIQSMEIMDEIWRQLDRQYPGSAAGLQAASAAPSQPEFSLVVGTD